MITFEPLWDLLKEKEISTLTLQDKYGFSPVDICRLRYNHNFTLKMLNKLCKILHCQPGDIIRYVPNEKSERKT